MKNRIKAFALVVVMLIGLLVPGMDVLAAVGKTGLTVSANTLNIGDTVSITAKATAESGGSAYATMTLSYDASILEFVSCSATYGGGKGSISVSIDTFTVTLKAIAAGTSGISLSAEDGVEFSTGEELSKMEGSSTSITVNNAASNGGSTGGNTGGESNENNGGTSGGTNGGSAGENNSGNNGGTPAEPKPVLSGDNSLKSLTLSAGTLSPAFESSTVNYTAAVANDVTNVAVSAVVSNEKAAVQSVSGNTNLKVGQNVIKIVVKAENGTTATYTINVNRLSANLEEPEPTEAPVDTKTEVSFLNASYLITEQIPSELIPAGFSGSAVNYQGVDYQGLTFDNGTLSVFYLVNAEQLNDTGVLAVYDETRDVFYPLSRLNHNSNYVIPLMAPVDLEVPETYTNTKFVLSDGTAVSAYQLLSEEDAQTGEFYLFYGVNQDGEEGWYQYDLREETYQRILNPFAETEAGMDAEQYEYLLNSYNKLKEQYREEMVSAGRVRNGLIFAVAVLIILFINVFVFLQKKNTETEDLPAEEWSEADSFTENEERLSETNRSSKEEEEPLETETLSKEEEELSEAEMSSEEEEELPKADSSVKEEEPSAESEEASAEADSFAEDKDANENDADAEEEQTKAFETETESDRSEFAEEDSFRVELPKEELDALEKKAAEASRRFEEMGFRKAEKKEIEVLDFNDED